VDRTSWARARLEVVAASIMPTYGNRVDPHSVAESCGWTLVEILHHRATPEDRAEIDALLAEGALQDILATAEVMGS